MGHIFDRFSDAASRTEKTGALVAMGYRPYTVRVAGRMTMQVWAKSREAIDKRYDAVAVDLIRMDRGFKVSNYAVVIFETEDGYTVVNEQNLRGVV